MGVCVMAGSYVCGKNPVDSFLSSQSYCTLFPICISRISRIVACGLMVCREESEWGRCYMYLMSDGYVPVAMRSESMDRVTCM